MAYYFYRCGNLSNRFISSLALLNQICYLARLISSAHCYGFVLPDQTRGLHALCDFRL